ncbi:hypothetical protein ACFWIQ_27600 [Kitasatospora sp. NPDC127059]|uniref:hypothetical protein n=1 Tax=unclassified Kitasatospora TaxID=2633591 RepID=UPI0036672849
MNLTFSVQSGAPLSGTLNYLTAEHSFLFEAQSRADLVERIGAGGVTSVVVDTLQLEVGIESGEALFVWGYFPRQSWIPARLTTPNHSPGRVFVGPEEPFEEGVSIPIPASHWRVEYDPSNGWIVARAGMDAGAQFIQIAGGTVLGIDNTRLISIWLKPVFSL